MAGKCWESKIEDRAKLFESCGLVDALPRNPVCQVLGCLITTVLNVRIDLHNIKIKKHPVLLIMHHVFVQWNCRFLLKFHRCIVNFGLLLVLEPFPFSIPEEKGRNLYYDIILIFLQRDYINLTNDQCTWFDQPCCELKRMHGAPSSPRSSFLISTLHLGLHQTKTSIGAKKYYHPMLRNAIQCCWKVTGTSSCEQHTMLLFWCVDS